MSKSRAYKPAIFSRLFAKRWNPITKVLTNPMVNIIEIREEYEALRVSQNLTIKNTNPPAFMKDFIRRRRLANASWPPEILAAGYTARQVTGGGRNFEFIPLAPGQTEPFPSNEPSPDSVKPHAISSIELSLASRRLGRGDEPWLVQVSVRLHVVETYFALFSARKESIRQVDHLQNGLKLREAEIDALFLGIEETADGQFQEFVITCEAKGFDEDINPDQMLQQIREAFKLANVSQPFIVPVAIKAISASKIQIIEYGEVLRDEVDALDELSVVNHAVFDLIPPVPGIGAKNRGKKKKS